MKRKLTALILAAVMLCTTGLLFTGCGPKADLYILLLANTTEQDFYREYFQQKGEELGITIDFYGAEEKDYDDRLDADMQSHKPDIYYVRPNDILTDYGDLLCVDDYAEEHRDELGLDDVFPSALDMYRFDTATKTLGSGKLYAFPKDLSSQQLGYNRVIVEQYREDIKKAGVEKLPWEMDFSKENYTWDQYIAMCRAINRASGDQYQGCDIPSIEIIMKSYGGEILDADGKTVKIGEGTAFEQAVEVQKKLVQTVDGAHAASYQGATYADFASKHLVAFYGQCGSWELTDYKKQSTDYASEFSLGIMPWPTVDGGTGWNGLITSAGYVISADCKKKEEALAIASSFMTDEMQTRMVSEGLTLPLRQSLAAEFVKTENDELYWPSTRSVYIDVINGSHGFTPAKYRTPSDAWITPLNNELEKMWLGRTDYNLSAAAIQTRLQTELDTILAYGG